MKMKPEQARPSPSIAGVIPVTCAIFYSCDECGMADQKLTSLEVVDRCINHPPLSLDINGQPHLSTTQCFLLPRDAIPQNIFWIHGLQSCSPRAKSYLPEPRRCRDRSCIPVPTPPARSPTSGHEPSDISPATTLRSVSRGSHDSSAHPPPLAQTQVDRPAAGAIHRLEKAASGRPSTTTAGGLAKGKK